MKVECLNSKEDFASNCYRVSIGQHHLLIDPGFYDEEMGEDYDAILLTHRHFDHINGLSILKDKGIPIYCFDDGNPFFEDPLYNASMILTPYQLFKENITFITLKEGACQIGPFHFEVLRTQGHTSDSITFYFSQEKVMFCGDFLFKDGIGRCDLLTGNSYQMIESFKKIIPYLEIQDLIAYPGHGEEVSGRELLKCNVYLKKYYK